MKNELISHPPSDSTNAGDDPSGWHLLFAVQFVAGQLRQLQKWWPRIDQIVDTVPCDKFTFKKNSTSY